MPNNNSNEDLKLQTAFLCVAEPEENGYTALLSEIITVLKYVNVSLEKFAEICTDGDSASMENTSGLCQVFAGPRSKRDRDNMVRESSFRLRT